MSAPGATAPSVIDFALPAELEAHEPPEARGVARDGVRLLAAVGSEITHRRFADLAELLSPGDVLVVNTSATLPAAVPVTEPVAGSRLLLHFSTSLVPSSTRLVPFSTRVESDRPAGADRPATRERWLVEVRRDDGGASVRYHGTRAGQRLPLPGGAAVRLLEPHGQGRLWVAEVATGVPVLRYLSLHGRPIRYRYVPRAWPLEYYQTVFATHPGSAEMPSAGRPFTDRMVTRLVSAGVQFAPVLLHTGVASAESHERPYPEYVEVGEATARLVNGARSSGGRIIAVGTTAVRALETAATAVNGDVRPARGWTNLIVTPARGVRVVDGLITGFHEPRASHLDMLAALAGPRLLAECYGSAIDHGYLWHEFGDLNLLLPGG